MSNIKTESLIVYLETFFDKNIISITENDLKSIRGLAISGTNIYDKHIKMFIEDLLLFPNLQEITICRKGITKQEINEIAKIQTLKIINFDRCEFEDEYSISNLNKINVLKFYKCYIENYSFLKSFDNLIEFSLKKPEDQVSFDINVLSNNINLRSLSIEEAEVVNLDKLTYLINVERLSLIKSSFPNSIIDTLNKMPNLKLLYSAEKINIDQLKNKNLIIANRLDEYPVNRVI